MKTKSLMLTALGLLAGMGIHLSLNVSTLTETHRPPHIPNPAQIRTASVEAHAVSYVLNLDQELTVLSVLAHAHPAQAPSLQPLAVTAVYLEQFDGGVERLHILGQDGDLLYFSWQDRTWAESDGVLWQTLVDAIDQTEMEPC